MGALLARIAREIGDRVEAAVRPHELFASPAPEALALLRAARALLEQWQAAYLTARERIEAGGRDARWEFPRGPLFGRTGYMAEVCAGLAEAVAAADDFLRFLGPELRAVTGEGGRRRGEDGEGREGEGCGW